MNLIKSILVLFSLIALWVIICIYGAFSGWWLSPVAAKNDHKSFVSEVKQKIQKENQGNVALIVLANGEVIAEDYSASNDTINAETMFPMASVSKFVSAYGIMRLVESKQIDLDEPISTYLTRWQLPKSIFNNDKITVRQLLSHTSGLVDGLGFGDYEPNEVLPSLIESLNKPRSSNGNKVIKLGREPGTEWDYSGGGYLILQLLVEETSGIKFEDWMQKMVFLPLQMNRSNYEYIGDQDNISHSYTPQGQRATLFRYASSAATGLSSTPVDLVKFVKALLEVKSEDKDLLSNASIKLMRKPHGYKMGADIWGLGTMLYAPADDANYVFGHDGANEPAINTSLRINPINGDAIIVLATGSKNLASSVAYEWTLWQTGYPDFLSLDKALKSALLPGLFGVIFIFTGFAFINVRRSHANTSRFLLKKG